MANKEIQGLTQDTTPAAADELETQKIAGGAGSSKRVTLDDVITQAAPVATGSVKGVMSAADKTLIDSSLFFSKVDATTAPTTTDDSDASYEVGSVWVDVTNDKAYICLDATVSAAVWTEVTQTGGGSPFQYVATLEKTALYTILSADAGKLLTASGTFTLTLPTSFTNVGQDFIDIINIGTGSVTVSAGTDGINVGGNDTLVLGPGELVRLTYAAAADPKWRARTADYSLLSSGAGAPSANAIRVGEIYVDITNDVAYISIQTGTGATDWAQSSGEAVAGTSAQIIVYDGSGDIQSVTMTGDASISNTGVVTVVDANIDHGSIGGLTDDDHSGYTTNSSGAVTPVSNQTPVRVGEIYVDTVLDTAWVATGTADTDWEQIDGAGGGDTLPIVDTTAVVKGSADATKLVRIEADGLTTSTTRVITMPDNDVDLGTDFATAAQGSTADSALQDVVDDTAPQLGGQLDINGNAIGDGTLELITFTETGSAVNQVNITNAATGNAPKLSPEGETNVDLEVSGKGTGGVNITSDANMADNVLSRPNIKDYAVESTGATDGATVTLDLAADGNDQTLTLSQNITLAFSNWPPTGTLGKVTFQCTQDSDTAKTVTVTNVDKWPGGTAWVMSTGLSAIDEVVFWSRDAGTTVYGAVIGQAFA